MSTSNSRRGRSLVVYIITVAVAALLLWAGHSAASTNLPDVHEGEELPIPQKARVTLLGAKTESTQTVGDETFYLGENLSFHAKILSGERRGQLVMAVQNFDPYFPVQLKEVEVGDLVMLFPNDDPNVTGDWLMGEYVRTDALLWLGLIFFVCLLVFGRMKGLNTIFSLCFTCTAIFAVFIPAVLSGKNIYLWSIGICVFIIAMTLLIVNGPDRKSLCAALGCAAGVLMAGAITLLVNHSIRLTGMVDDDSLYLLYLNPERPTDLVAIIFAAIIIGAVGAIMDVSMSLSSALWELREKLPDAPAGLLFRSGLNIGRDIMGTMANTLVLAYIGSSLSVVLLLIAYNTSLLYLLNREMIVVEILQALVGSFGILSAIPLTSLVCAALYPRKGPAGPPEPGADEGEAPWDGLTPLSPIEE